MIVGLISALCMYAIIAWRSREHALVVLVAALPLYLVRFSLGPMPTTLLECMIGVLFLVWLIRERRFFAALADGWRAGKTLFVFLLLFLIAATISVVVSQNTRAAAGIWRAYFIEPAIVFLVVMDTVHTKEQLLRMIAASAVSALGVASVAVYQKFTGWHIPAPWLSEMRVTSVYPYPNAVGLYLAPIIPLALVQFFDLVKIRRTRILAMLFLGASILSFVAIYFAKTEGALVALAVILPLMGLAWSKKTRILTAVVCGVVTVLIVLSPGMVPVFQEKLSLQDWSGKVRQKTWKETRAMLFDHRVFGAGLAGYQQAMEPYHKAKHLEIFLYPHTIILNFWSETGLLGLFSFFIIVFIFFAVLYRSTRIRGRDTPFVRLYSFGLCGAMLIILVHGFVDAPYFKNDLAVFFWLLLAYAVCVRRSAQAVKSI